MLLKLHYTESVRHATCAAFIRGNSPHSWLKEMSRWGIAVHQLDCYIVPESLQSLQPAGLFVVIRVSGALKPIDFIEPYGLLTDRLYVPIHADLFPEVSPQELQNLLLWDCQLFHPTIGLVGFSPADKLDLATLLELTQPKATNWNLAHPGLPAKPLLQRIQVLQPTAAEVMQTFQESLDKKPLEDIPDKKENKPSALSQLMDQVKRGVLRTLLTALDKLKSAFNSKEEESTSTPASARSKTPATSSGAQHPSSPGMLERFENWMMQNLEELERRRNTEIKRLLDLFDKDTDEALKYAIPLDSPYQNRGTAPPSSQLSRRSTKFSLGGLGGGGKVDGWNVDHYYQDLRTKYLRAAQKEIEAKDFKKAAYVYAHLLGDYHSAAKVLEQGKHYREAAALHKDHLNNIPAAAECLERGGLLLEAVELYVQLEKHEKAGDLYKKMEQTQLAEQYYDQTIDTVLANGDYLDASRIMRDKLENTDRAKKTLLKGWQNSNQTEPCLKQYFDLVVSTEEQRISHQVQEVFDQHTPKHKRTQFLNTLVYVNGKTRDTDLLATSRNVAYQIVSEQTEEGNLANLPTLKKFLPEDRLIASDCSRFTSDYNQKQARQKPEHSALQLDKSIKWFNAVPHRNQFLVLGVKDARLHLARGNWYGNFEYYSWADQLKANELFTLVAEQYVSNHVILHSWSRMGFDEKKLPKNKYFDTELVVSSPTWLPSGLVGFVNKGEEGMPMVVANKESMTLHYYDVAGALKRSVICSFGEEKSLLKYLEEESHLPISQSSALSDMIERKGQFYTFKGHFFMKISPDGLSHRLNVHAEIWLMACTRDTPARIALSTDMGCLLLRIGIENTKTSHDFFAQDILPIAIQFISSDLLVVAGKHKAIVYHISHNTVRPGQEFTSQAQTIAILPTATRNQFALLDETGGIVLCNIEAE